ncbi:MAG TPA: hypothetical protein VL101_07330 [Nordella sp.]|nr:hypothetical protein [Nordella sp.]
MLRLAKLLITLPVLALPLWGAAPALEAQEVMPQIDALRQIAKSRAADGKCRVLAPGEAEELSGYLARAEIAATGRQSVGEVKSAISLGKTLGGSSACTANTSDEIKATLDAARQAMAAVSPSSRVAEEDDVAREETVVPERRIRAPRPRNSSLAGYGRQAFAYFVERRCEYLSHRDVRAFWAAVVREHRAALSTYGRRAVVRTVKQAQAEADRVECGAKGRQMVRAEYTKLAGY